MDINLSAEQLQIQNLARDVAQKELAPKAAEVDRTSAFPRDSLRKLAEAGLMSLSIPHDFGGSKSDTLSTVLVMEELAKACPSTAEILSMHLWVGGAIVVGGTEDTKHHLSSLASGEKLGAYAASEPGSGGDVMNVETSARADGDYYVVNGTKVFVTSGDEADLYVVDVRTDTEQPGPMGQSKLLIEKGTPGFSFGTSYDRMGFRGTSPRELIFEDCRVPKANLLGGEGGFMNVQMAIGAGSMLEVAAISLGIAQVAAEAATKYAKERLQVRQQPLTSYQAVRLILVEMSTMVDAARAMVYRAAVLADNPPPGPPLDSFKAKLFATEMAVEVTNKALQIHGGTGYCRDLPIERYYRDARGMTLNSLPTELLKDTIAMFLLG
jgi:butyryl-CoA dehydrogenase